jgi:hemoglobin
MNTNTSLFALMGGEEAVKRLVETFYDIVEYEPAGVALNILHLRGHGVAHSRLEQFNFLSGFLGGPKLYADKHGHSNVRKMHEHVVINAEARDAWLNCMQMAMDRMDIAPDRKETIMTHFRVVAKQLQNAD